MPALSVEHVTVRTGRLSVLVRVAAGTPRFSSPDLAARLCEWFPTLPFHACVNEVGETFGCVMGSTSLPHVLEHLVIDLQVRASASADAPNGCTDAPSASADASALGAGAAPSAQSGPANPAPAFVGTTEWLDQAAGTARIEVSFADDLVALRALRDAADILNRAVVS